MIACFPVTIAEAAARAAWVAEAASATEDIDLITIAQKAVK